MNTDAIANSCIAVGGQAAMARILGITPAAVSQWVKGLRAVPAERCPDIERATRERGAPVLCEELRPDIPWSVLRSEATPTEAAT